MKIGCHAVLYGPKLVEETEKVFEQIHTTGFEGAEVGIRFMQAPGAAEKVLDTAARYGVEISAIHAGCTLMALVDDPADSEAKILEAIKLAKTLKYKNIAMSGTPFVSFQDRTPDDRLKDPDFVKKMVLQMEHLAKLAKAEGVSLNYHNHSWEFENDAMIFNAILKFAPTMNFALDTGWAFFSGYDPIKLIRENPDRYHYVHIRDYNNEQKEFVNIGEGDMDLRALFEILKKTMADDDWAIVEYETGPCNYKRYLTAKLYLNYITC